MVLINKVDTNNISMFSEYDKWYSILQFKHGRNNIAQYNFNFSVCDFNNKNVILHSYNKNRESVKRSMRINPDNCELYISDRDLTFKNCNYIVSPVKNDNEIQMHIIESNNSDRRVLVHTPEETYNYIMSIRDSINIDLSIGNRNYLINIRNNKDKYNIVSKTKNNLEPDFSTDIIDSNQNIWDEFICADSSIGIRIEADKEITVDRNKT